MFKHVYITRKNNTELRLTRSVIKAAFELTFILIFIGLWYSTLIEDFSSVDAIEQSITTKVSEQMFLILFFLAPLMLVKRIWLSLSTLLFGNTHVFNRRTRRVTHNKKVICQFSDIKNVQIRRIEDTDSDGDNNDSYRLTINYADSKKIFIAENTDHRYISGLASDIARICETKVEYRN